MSYTTAFVLIGFVGFSTMLIQRRMSLAHPMWIPGWLEKPVAFLFMLAQIGVFGSALESDIIHLAVKAVLMFIAIVAGITGAQWFMWRGQYSS